MSTQNCPRCQAPLPAGTPPAQCPRCLLRLGLDTGFAGGQESSARRPAPSPAELAPDFPQLEILELLGQGGMGAVYRARQKSLDRQVALKVLTLDGTSDPDFAARFAREARALAALDHPNIVRVHDSGQAGGRFYLLMEHVDGTDLRHMLRSGRIAPREGLAIVAQVCDALQYAHDQGIVHRDIKPENLLVDRRGRVKIADFGLAKLVGKAGDAFALTGTNQAMGTAHYMAPEQIEHPQDVDHRADIYSLGVVLYELLTGELPLGRFVPPSRKVEIDVRLDEVVLKALEKDLPRRYQHASEVKSSIDGIASGLSARPADGAGTGERCRRWSRTPAGKLVLGTALVCFLACVVFLVSNWGNLTVRTASLLMGPWFLLLMAAGVLFFVGVWRSSRAAPRSGWPWLLACGVLVLLTVPLLIVVVGALLLVGPVVPPEGQAGSPLAAASGAAPETLDETHGALCPAIDAARELRTRGTRMTELERLARQPGLSAHEQLHLAEALLDGGFFDENAAGLVALIEHQELDSDAAALIRRQVDGEDPGANKSRVLEALEREGAPEKP